MQESLAAKVKSKIFSQSSTNRVSQDYKKYQTII